MTLKRLYTLLLSVFALFAFTNTVQAQTQSGTYGSLTWTLTNEGTFTISGTGIIPNNAYNIDGFLKPYKDDVIKIVIKDGITGIGDLAFYQMDLLFSVEIANSVMSIGASAFSMCDDLTSVTIGSGVNSIGIYAFSQCFLLSKVIVLNPNPVTINANTFQEAGGGVVSGIALIVPVGSEGDYQDAPVWKDLGKIISCGAISTFPHTEGFEDDSYLCWTTVDFSSHNFLERSSGPRTGTYSWAFSSYTEDIDYNQYLITPELPVTTNSKTISFYYRDSYANGEIFRVGYSTTDNAVESFTWLSPVTATDDEWHLHTVGEISAEAKYIAINYNPGTNLYKLYIDDITISEVVAADPESDMVAAFYSDNTLSTEISTLSIDSDQDLVLYPYFGNLGPDATNNLARVLLTIASEYVYNEMPSLTGSDAISAGDGEILINSSDPFTVTPAQLDAYQATGTFAVTLSVIYAGTDPDASNNTAVLMVTRTNIVTGVSLDKTTLNIEVNETEQLTATVAPADADNQNVTWSSSNEAVATVSEIGLVTAISAGTATITVTTEDGGHTDECEVTVNKRFQVITFDALAGVIIGDEDFAPGATASSNLTITYTSSDEEVATIVDGLIHIVGAGTTTITASQVGNNEYYAAESISQTLTVNKKSQTITFDALADVIIGNEDFTPGASSTSGLTITYTSSNEEVATIVDGLIHIVGAGTTTITASQAGNNEYYAAESVSQELTVNKKSQTITFDALADVIMGDADFAPGASSISGLTITYTSSNEEVATIVDGLIHIVGAGITTITASQAGNNEYYAAEPISQTLTVNKKPQVITFDALADVIVGDADFAPGATASSNLTITYTSSDEEVATIVDGLIHIIGAGTTTITASQAGNNEYYAAENVSQVLTVNKKSQTITFDTLAYVIIGDEDFAPGATTSSNLTITYTSSNEDVVTIVDGLIHIVGAGTTTITASQVGNNEYYAAEPVSQTLTVNKKSQAITFDALADVIMGDADFAPGASSTSDLVITYTSSNEDVATIVDGLIHIIGAGTTTITASQAGNNEYYAAESVSQELTVNKKAQAITFDALADVIIGDEDFAPGASSTSGLIITYTSSNEEVATIVDGLIHIIGAGTTTITASQAGNNEYYAAESVSQELTVNKKSQTITFNALADVIMGDEDFTPGASSTSGLAITYTSSDEEVATIVDGLVHIVGAGTTTITASQAGNNEYYAAESVSQELTVNKKSQTITFNALADVIIGDEDFTPGASSTSGLVITYTSSDEEVATIVDGLIHIVGAGTTTITASQAGNNEYYAAESVSQELTVNKKSQAITFDALADVIMGDADFAPGASSTSDLVITYTSSDEEVATIVDGLIHIVGAGTTTITASQAGNNEYYAAESVSQTLTVNPGVSIPEIKIVSLTVYPNPVMDRLYIDSSVEIEKVIIVSLNGAVVSQQVNVMDFIDTSRLARGVYMVTVFTKQGNVQRKIIKD